MPVNENCLVLLSVFNLAFKRYRHWLRPRRRLCKQCTGLAKVELNAKNETKLPLFFGFWVSFLLLNSVLDIGKNLSRLSQKVTVVIWFSSHVRCSLWETDEIIPTMRNYATKRFLHPFTKPHKNYSEICPFMN